MQASSQTRDATLNSHLAIDAQAVGSLRARAAKDPKGTSREVAQQFEKMFLDMVMKSMREASPKFSDLDHGKAMETFQSMYDEQLSQNLTGGKGKGLGLADMIAHQIARQSDPKSAKTPIHRLQSYDFGTAKAAGTGNAVHLDTTAHNTAVKPNGSHAANTPAADKTTDFVAAVGDAAVSAAGLLGLSPHLMLAHAALESGWGKKPITDAKGNNSHNLFGIKAGSDWTGKTADITTTEYVDGVAQKRVERFRAYDSYTEAFADYAGLLAKRYGSATQAGGDAKAFADSLQQGGYATDPNYAQKLAHVAESPALRAYKTA